MREREGEAPAEPTGDGGGAAKMFDGSTVSITRAVSLFGESSSAPGPEGGVIPCTNAPPLLRGR